MRVVLTGAVSGLGAAILDILIEAGHEVLGTYNSSTAKAQDIERLHSNVRLVKCDFQSRESVSSFCEKLTEFAPEILVNNALTGFTERHNHKLNTEDFKDSFEKNVLPVLSITQAAIVAMRKQKAGKIITILTSYLVNRPPAGMSEYVSNKAYLHAMSKSWAVENQKFNISSNCISPSFMKTGLTADTDERLVEIIESGSPAKSLITPAEVAKAVEYLMASSNHLNGHNLILNAGENI